jgi:hypothetical protein
MLTGKLPDHAQFQRVWASYGHGQLCDGCDREIKADELECELEFRAGTRSSTIRLHRDCWTLWGRERSQYLLFER